MKNKSYFVSSIVAAGLIPASTVSADESNHISADKSLIDDIIEHAESVTNMHVFDLAGHSSHRSHSSHSSHRSYLRPERPDPGPTYKPTSEDVEIGAQSGRNENSTPRSSVLPTSPVTAKKPKVLKGNSAKFAEIVTRVQLALVAHGYDPGKIDGGLRPRTIAAIYKFQRDRGLVPTGKLENDTLTKLGVVAG